MRRPTGASAGALGLLMAWVGGAAIARLTGATPVLIVLIVAVVMGIVAVFAGFITVTRTQVLMATLPRLSTQGEETPVTIELGGSRPVWVEVRDGDLLVASGWSQVSDRAHEWSGRATFAMRGQKDRLSVGIRSAGASGLIWWTRSHDVPIAAHLVAARLERGAVFASVMPSRDEGESAGQLGAAGGMVDGVRPWRDGDSERFVHWASTLRSGELVVHDRRADIAQRWVIRARPGTDDPDQEAGSARRSLEDGLRSGASMFVAVGTGTPVEIRSPSAAAAWSATAELGAREIEPAVRWRDRVRAPRARVEPESTASPVARWWAAITTVLSLAMLMTSLDYGLVGLALMVLGVGTGAFFSAKSLVSGDVPSTFVRTITGLGALVGLVAVVASSGRFEGLLQFLRGPLPKVLIVLIVLHGFECRDRRTIRAAIAISAVVVMYASALRVDESLLWWLLAWMGAFGMTIVSLSRPTTAARHASYRLRWLSTTGVVGLGGLGAFALLAVVPIPAGPARLTLPTLISNDASAVGRPGAVAGPDGEVRDTPESPETDPERAPIGQAGGYTGFAEAMDTSVRGVLSDEIVMRVRAPEADFWRGQTFADFDGRRWYADDETGVRRDGPNVTVPPALGDVQVPGDVVVDEFIQTFYLETDMPNLVFHAYRPAQVILDADVYTRVDGALRASTVLPEGSIYTVVSARPRVDATLLQRQGLIGERLNRFGRDVLGRYLRVPDSISARTRALADELAVGRSSTYDVVRSYEQWMADNVEYDLNAPVPDLGENAVDHFLFVSRSGFCEQIASALTIMLRTQGVPARLATGYLPGSRDPIAGVFDVRASDAHAWVEVWFPEVGWQAFDPTASVPLAADSGASSVGAGIASGLSSYVSDNSGRLLAVLALIVVGVLTSTLARIGWDRRRRGRWGVLQDRFTDAARRRGGVVGVPNPQLATVWAAADDAEVARLVAERLDRAAFDPQFVDTPALYGETKKLVGSLGGFWQ